MRITIFHTWLIFWKQGKQGSKDLKRGSKDSKSSGRSRSSIVPLSSDQEAERPSFSEPSHHSSSDHSSLGQHKKNTFVQTPPADPCPIRMPREGEMQSVWSAVDSYQGKDTKRPSHTNQISSIRPAGMGISRPVFRNITSNAGSRKSSAGGGSSHCSSEGGEKPDNGNL
jgi:hypothetical protein